jgi:hypothetical protein
MMANARPPRLNWERAVVLVVMAGAKNVHQLVHYRLQDMVNMVRLGIVGSQA